LDGGCNCALFAPKIAVLGLIMLGDPFPVSIAGFLLRLCPVGVWQQSNSVVLKLNSAVCGFNISMDIGVFSLIGVDEQSKIVIVEEPFKSNGRQFRLGVPCTSSFCI
jgi:hypothetical protein